MLETDPYGNFILSGYDYGTARNWARLAARGKSLRRQLGSKTLAELAHFRGVLASKTAVGNFHHGLLGLLYLQDGMWQGQRLLPEGWATFVSTPAPAWRQRYGGFFWLNRTGVFDLPPDAYYALGAGGQIMLVVPSRQLVVVRLGRSTGSQAGMRALNNALGLLTGAIRER